MIKYVCGYAFDKKRENVLLIRKKKGPRKVVGRLIGLGGKVEEGESWWAAMQREFREESGLWVAPWTEIFHMVGEDAEIKCYKGFSDQIHMARQQPGETEELAVIPVEYILSEDLKVEESSKWLIMMSLDCTFIKGEGRIIR